MVICGGQEFQEARIWFAWGHGGQMIVIMRDLNMVIVSTASLPSGVDNNAWQKSWVKIMKNKTTIK